MRMFAFPSSVISSDHNRLSQLGERVDYDNGRGEFVFVSKPEKMDFFIPRDGCFDSEFEIYKNDKTNTYYIAKKNASYGDWQELGSAAEVSGVATHANCLIYKKPREPRKERRVWIKDIISGYEYSIGSAYWVAEYGFGNVLLLSGDGMFHAIDIRSGEVLWRARLAMPNDRVFFRQHGYLVCVAKPVGEPQELYVVDISTGKMLLQSDLDAPLAPIPSLLEDGHSLYVRTRKSIYVLDLETLGLRSFLIEAGEFGGSGAFVHADRIYLSGGASADESAWIMAYDLSTGEKIAAHEFSQYRNSGNPFKLGEYIGIDFNNRTEIPGWYFKRFLIFQPSQFATLNQSVVIEPIIVELHKELDNRGESQYRVIVPPCDRFETFIWQLEIGAHSCGQAHGVHLNSETKPYDDDFAGQIILDCRNRTLDDVQKSRIAKMITYVTEQLTIFNYVDAIKQNPIRISCEF